MERVPRSGSAGTFLIVTILVIGALAFEVPVSQPRNGSGVGVALQAGTPECPFHHLTDSQLPPDVGPLARFPEFHDCQSFAIQRNANWAFEGLFAIYAIPAQEKLWSRMADAPTQAHLAAVIQSWGSYRQLGINQGMNCLYLVKTNNPNRVRAKVLQNGTERDCPDEIPRDSAAITITELFGLRSSLPALAGHYPVAGRWDWDPVRNEYYMGVMCSGWCEVGRSGFTPGPTYSSGSTNPLQRRVMEIKGWYDEQRVALPAAAPVGVATSTIAGTAFPHASLDGYDEEDFVGTWLPSARVALATAAPAYATKLNLHAAPAGGPPAQFARVSLCKGTQVECNVPAAVTCSWGTAKGWWVLIRSSGGILYKCVERRVHPPAGLHVLGSVRWRWKWTDETLWIRCGNGCCEVDQ